MMGGVATADNADLRTRIAELEAMEAQNQSVISSMQSQMDELRATTGDNWLTEQRSEEMRGLVHDVLADADTRSSLMQSGMTAGWDKGFFLASPDGNFKLAVKGQIQFRYIRSSQDNSAVDDHRSGFENTRTRFGFAGHVLDPTWKYFIWAGWTGDGSSILLDSWVMKDLGNGWYFQAGQFKLPNWQEWVVSETRQQFVERSVLDGRWASIYGQGIQLHYKSDTFRLQMAYTDGLRTLNTAYGTGPGTTSGPIPVQTSTEESFTARAEFLFDGAWGQYNQFTSWNGDDTMCILGASIHYQQGEFGTADVEQEIFQWTLDGSFKFGGANLYAAAIGTHIDSDAMVSRDEMGFLLQGGVFLNDDWELIGRFEMGDLDGAGTIEDDLSILSFGVNRFWNRHALKWTTDIGYAFDAVDSAWGGAGRGYRADASVNDDGQVVIRSQLNLLF